MGVDYVTLEEFAGMGGGEKSALDHLYEEHAKEKRELTPSKGVVCWHLIENIYYLFNYLHSMVFETKSNPLFSLNIWSAYIAFIISHYIHSDYSICKSIFVDFALSNFTKNMIITLVKNLTCSTLHSKPLEGKID